MKLSEVEKNWKEHLFNMDNERLQLNIIVDIQREPGGDNYVVMIREEESNGYRGKVSSTQDVAEALRRYIEEEI